jgi:hypothetical protein
MKMTIVPDALRAEKPPVIVPESALENGASFGNGYGPVRRQQHVHDVGRIVAVQRTDTSGPPAGEGRVGHQKEVGRMKPDPLRLEVSIFRSANCSL